MIIFDTSKFYKLLDDEWLDGLYTCPNSISNWFISWEKRTYKPTHYHDDQIYAHKEQTVTTLILNEYQQSSNSSVPVLKFQCSKTTQNAYC
jgi:hypothetical protein